MITKHRTAALPLWAQIEIQNLSLCSCANSKIESIYRFFAVIRKGASGSLANIQRELCMSTVAAAWVQKLALETLRLFKLVGNEWLLAEARLSRYFYHR
jgi:hypothetical protein